jgi:hypothetical protein
MSKFDGYTINGVQYRGVTNILDILDKSKPLMIWAVECVVEYIKQKMSNVSNLIHIFNINLLDEAKTSYREVNKQAKDIGTEFHDIVEQFSKMKIKSYDLSLIKQLEKEAVFIKNIQKYASPILNKMFSSWHNWQTENVKEFLLIEYTVVAEKEAYAGTMDIVYRTKRNTISADDYKTGKTTTMYDNAPKQISAYKYAIENMEEKEYNVLTRHGNTRVFIHKKIKIDECGVVVLSKTTGDLRRYDITDKYKSRLNAFLRLLDFYYADKKRRLKNNPRVKECI